MRNVFASALWVMLAVVIAGMMAAGCEKRTAESGKQAADESEKQTVSGESQRPAGAEQQAGGGAGEETAAGAGSESASKADTQPPAGGDVQSTQSPAAAQQPAAPAGTQPSAESGQQAAGETPAAADAAAEPAADPAGETAAPTGESGSFKYVGVSACSICHKGAAKGAIYEQWLASSHAKAFENLGAENQQNEVCLRCHTTGYGKPLAANVTPQKMVNVQCEACHGPGSEYKPLATMKNREEALKKGLVLPTKELCLTCHGGTYPEGHPEVTFDYESALRKIEHHGAPTGTVK